MEDRIFCPFDLNFISNSLKDCENEMDYIGDLSDCGNEIGLIVGECYEDMTVGEIEDFIVGIRHGISLTNGTH